MKLFTFLTISILISTFAKSQEYTLPFPEVKTAWITQTWGGGTLQEPFSEIYRHYINDIDTNYQDTIYHTLFKGSESPFNFFIDSSNLNYYLTGYYRVEDQKVIYRQKLNNENLENVLYDFSIEVGDSFYYYNMYTGETLAFILDSIDTILINNYNYRKFNFSDFSFTIPGELYWIEGIGSKSGFFPFEGRIESNNTLSCFYSNNHGIGYDYNFNIHTCYNLGFEELENSRFKIHPNPTSDILQLETREFIDEIIIHDSRGNQIYQSKFTKIIDISSFEKGIYFITAKFQDKNLQIEKVIKL